MQQRPPLREKFVEITEALFQGSEPFKGDAETFWDAYLMLPVNVDSITQLIRGMPEESLIKVGHNISLLFTTCLVYLETSESNIIRQQHAMQIMSCLMRQLYLKKRLSHFNLIQLLAGIEKADSVFSSLIKALAVAMARAETRSEALTLALTFSAGADNVNQNQFNGYFLHNDISDSLIRVIADEKTTRQQLEQCFMLWIMLSNYNKYEVRNTYTTRLSRCKDKLVLERIAGLYTEILPEMTSEYIKLKDDQETVAQSMAAYMTSWFSGGSSKSNAIDMDNPESVAHLPPSSASLLLGLYDLISSNSHFVTTILLQFPQLIPNILSFASYLFQHNRHQRAFLYSRLILLLLQCFPENNAIVGHMMKEETQAVVRLCRQRPNPLPRVKKPRSLCCTSLDVLLTFIKYNMRKKLDLASYRLVFITIQRILQRLKDRSIRLEYHWPEMWGVLTSLLHFIVGHLEEFQFNEDFDPFISAYVGVINICLAQGEHFLHDTTSYDTLFYEVIRSTNDFMALAQYVTRNSALAKKASPDRSPLLTTSDFNNIKLVCNHFNPALEEYQTAHRSNFLTPEKVMEIIRENYDTLELSSMDSKLHLNTALNELPSGFLRQVSRLSTADAMQQAQN